jgi:hypothetical protein
MHVIRTLPTGQPGQRLRHLAAHYHAFGPRALLDLVERVIDGRLPDATAIVEFLERAARSDPRIIRAIGGYELPLPLFDSATRSASTPSWPPEATAFIQRRLARRAAGGRAMR